MLKIIQNSDVFGEGEGRSVDAQQTVQARQYPFSWVFSQNYERLVSSLVLWALRWLMRSNVGTTFSSTYEAGGG